MKFSVIIPTYNRGWVIKESVNSVLRQSFNDYEVIVVVDGSVDDTIEILKEFNDKIIVLIKENEGPSQARNFGAKNAKGEYLIFLDDDDIFFPFTLEVYNKIITAKNYPPFLVGQAIFFSEEKKLLIGNKVSDINIVTYKDYFSKDRSIFTSSSMMVVRKDIFQKIEGFRSINTKQSLVHEDFHFLLKVGTFGPAVIILEPKLYGYRTHNQNSVKDIPRVLNSILVLIKEFKTDEKLKYNLKKYGKFLIIGGTSYYWIKKALKNGIIIDSMKLLLKSFPMILLSFLNKIFQIFGKKVPIEKIKF
jgi:glycosyltransferase involved in cell wall biosynthesis